MLLSISKVLSFIDLILETNSYFRPLLNPDITAEEWFLPKAVSIYYHINERLEEFDSKSDKLDVIIKEYFIALWGNSIEAYNMYRRTGKPNNMMPGLDLDIGDFPRSLLYPSTHFLNASMANQKTLTDLVFWDDGLVVCR